MKVSAKFGLRKGRQFTGFLKNPNYPLPKTSPCEFLRSREDIDRCTRYLQRYGYESHAVKCKDWDLVHILPEITDGNFLDMGSSDSFILKNISFRGVRGELHGIDLREPDDPVRGVHYSKGDLIATNYPDRYFKNVTCLSVIEHGVDFGRFAAECSRLLVDGGKLFVTFDFWEPKVVPPIKMYDLVWQPLDRQAVRDLIDQCGRHGLVPVREVDWTLGDAVINKDYYSPHPSVSYTFGLLTFKKQPAA